MLSLCYAFSYRVLILVHLFLAVSRDRGFSTDSKIAHAIANYLYLYINKISLRVTDFWNKVSKLFKGLYFLCQILLFFMDALNVHVAEKNKIKTKSNHTLFYFHKIAFKNDNIQFSFLFPQFFFHRSSCCYNLNMTSNSLHIPFETDLIMLQLNWTGPSRLNVAASSGNQDCVLKKN